MSGDGNSLEDSRNFKGRVKRNCGMGKLRWRQAADGEASVAFTGETFICLSGVFLVH